MDIKFILKKKGFTLIEVLLVVVIIAVLSGLVVVAINPESQISAANDARRQSDLSVIHSAIYQYTIDNRGSLPLGINEGDLVMIGTDDTSNCSFICGDHGTTIVDCLDLSNDLVPAYVAAIPVDPKGTDEISYYAVTATSAGRPKIVSCLVEGGSAQGLNSVTYNGNGHTSGTVPVDENSPYEDGDEVTVLSHGDLVREGYTFNSWNTMSGGGGETYVASDTFIMEEKVALYAQWDAIDDKEVDPVFP